MHPALYRVAGLTAGAVLAAAWRTCSYHRIDDPRPALRREGRRYVIALRHAHQLAAVMGNDEPRGVAMVSRSRDANLLVPSLRTRGIEVVRGSSRTRNADKGGRSALDDLAARVREGWVGLMTVDGPRGPRGRVHSGVAHLALRCDAAIVPLLVTPSRRWILRGTWDRFQIPKPFSAISGYFGAAINGAAEPPRALARRVADALDALEQRHDPDEWRGF